MEEAEKVCDQIFIIDSGTIIASGTPSELLLEYPGEVSVEFVLSTEYFNESLAGDEDITSVADGRYMKCSKRVGGIPEARKFVSQQLERFGDNILEIKIVRPNLEDIFINLTGKKIVGGAG